MTKETDRLAIQNKRKERIDVSTLPTFVRKADLEGFFPAIIHSPVVKVTVVKDILIFDPTYYHPRAIKYFSEHGFYPFSYDAEHNKLQVILNGEFKFPKELFMDEGVPVEQENILISLRANFDWYEPLFLSTIPKFLAANVRGMDDIEFQMVNTTTFVDLISYVCNPSQIKVYELQKKISDNRERGLIQEDFDSLAGDILDSILTYAVTHRATDVHIEYTGSEHRARIRVDGDLVIYPSPLEADYYAAVINVIRNRCELDISEHFRPQDGQMQFNCSFVNKDKVSSYYDIRVSIIPQVDGRLNAVLRIQPKGEFKKLNELGFSEKIYGRVGRLCEEPHGLILVTGPTGCGKTTTLYSLLNEMNKMDVKILTVEDPPEIRMDGLTQVSVNEKQGRTFPTMLKYFLRHDPDIILVGEIRDPETAKIAINAANTGHLVLSTLHTNDAPSSIKRLGTMEGVDPADFAFSLKGVLAQRLIKTFRQDVRQVLSRHPMSEKDFDLRNASDKDVKRYFDEGKLFIKDLGEILNAEICEDFFPLGKTFVYDGEPDMFQGRTAITEFWKLGTQAQDTIFDKNFSILTLTQIAIDIDKMLPMAITGVEKTIFGWTSVNELIKSVGIEALRHYHKMIKDMYF